VLMLPVVVRRVVVSVPLSLLLYSNRTTLHAAITVNQWHLGILGRKVDCVQSVLFSVFLLAKNCQRGERGAVLRFVPAGENQCQ
jgi:hypothetical protein